MGEDDTTTVKLKRDTWKELNSKKEPGDSFDDVIRRLLNETDDEGNPTRMTPETAD
jgi:predicted CopG family antitoxin